MIRIARRTPGGSAAYFAIAFPPMMLSPFSDATMPVVTAVESTPPTTFTDQQLIRLHRLSSRL